MKKLIILCLLLVIQQQLIAQDSDIAVQASHNGFISKVLIDSKQNLMITGGSFTDKTIKFWDLKTSILLKTIDLVRIPNNVYVDEQEGKTFYGTSDEMVVINNRTLKEINRWPIKNLRQFVYNPNDKILYLVAGDYGEKMGFYEMNSNTGQINTSSAVWPSDGAANYAGLEANGTILSFKTEYMETVLYDVKNKQFGMFESEHLAFFPNADFLYLDYIDSTHVKIVRYNGYTQQTVWEKVLVIEKADQFTKAYSWQIAFTPNGKGLWVAPAISTLIELNADTGDVKGVIYTKTRKGTIVADNNYVYALERMDDKLFSNGYFYKYRRYDDKPLARFGHPLFIANTFSTINNNDEKGIVFSDLYGNVASIAANASATKTTVYNLNNNEDHSYQREFYPKDNSNEVYIGVGDNEGVKQLKRGFRNSYSNYFSLGYVAHAPEIDPNNMIMVSTMENLFEVFDLNTKKLIFSGTHNNVNQIVNRDIIFSKRNKHFAFLLNDEVIFDAEYKKRIDYYDYNSNRLVWSKEGEYSHAFFVANDSQMLAVNVKNATADILDISNGNLIRSFPLNITNYGFDLAVSPSQDRLISSNQNESSTIYDINSGSILSQSYDFKDYVFTGFEFLTDDIFVLNYDGIFKFYHVKDQKEILRLYVFLDGEWLAHTPEGVFDGSQNAWERVVYVKGKETIPLDQVFNQFYTPRLIHKIIKGDAIDRPEIDNIKRAPSVSINYEEGGRNLTVEDDVEIINTENASAKITVNANPNGDRISEIRLFHNGKRINSGSRNLTVEDDEPSGNSKAYNITLLEGENVFKSVALNSQKTESTPESLTVIYKRPKEVIQKVSGIQVHLMVIGIDVYKNPKYNLNYAVADANGFKESINKGMQPITTKINIYNIQNKDANRTNILETLQLISDNANPQDIFLFYYAGHGVVTQDEAKEFFLVPYDVTQLYGAVESLKQKGISAKELKQIAAGIPAQKQLYILDACQSAGALDAVASRGVAEEKAIAQLARSTGTHWLTASGSEQYATEFDELGHGVFTYALLEALSGKADSGDNRITVNELKAYLESRVPEISEQYKGSPQYPSSFGFGQDFPVSVYK